MLYWDIGREIVAKQRESGWGDSVVERLAADLRSSLPDARGFSANNVWLMRPFYLEYSNPEFLEQAVQETTTSSSLPEQPGPETRSGRKSATKAKTLVILEQPVQELQVRHFLASVPWGHHVEILKKIKGPVARLYDLRATAQLGWTRAVLLNQIKGRLPTARQLADVVRDQLTKRK